MSSIPLRELNRPVPARNVTGLQASLEQFRETLDEELKALKELVNKALQPIGPETRHDYYEKLRRIQSTRLKIFTKSFPGDKEPILFYPEQSHRQDVMKPVRAKMTFSLIVKLKGNIDSVEAQLKLLEAWQSSDWKPPRKQEIVNSIDKDMEREVLTSINRLRVYCNDCVDRGSWYDFSPEREDLRKSSSSWSTASDNSSSHEQPYASTSEHTGSTDLRVDSGTTVRLPPPQDRSAAHVIQSAATNRARPDLPTGGIPIMPALSGQDLGWGLWLEFRHTLGKELAVLRVLAKKEDLYLPRQIRYTYRGLLREMMEERARFLNKYLPGAPKPTLPEPLFVKVERASRMIPSLIGKWQKAIPEVQAEIEEISEMNMHGPLPSCPLTDKVVNSVERMARWYDSLNDDENWRTPEDDVLANFEHQDSDDDPIRMHNKEVATIVFEHTLAEQLELYHGLEKLGRKYKDPNGAGSIDDKIFEAHCKHFSVSENVLWYITKKYCPDVVHWRLKGGRSDKGHEWPSGRFANLTQEYHNKLRKRITAVEKLRWHVTITPDRLKGETGLAFKRLKEFYNGWTRLQAFQFLGSTDPKLQEAVKPHSGPLGTGRQSRPQGGASGGSNTPSAPRAGASTSHRTHVVVASGHARRSVQFAFRSANRRSQSQQPARSSQATPISSEAGRTASGPSPHNRSRSLPAAGGSPPRGHAAAGRQPSAPTTARRASSAVGTVPLAQDFNRGGKARDLRHGCPCDIL